MNMHIVFVFALYFYLVSLLFLSILVNIMTIMRSRYKIKNRGGKCGKLWKSHFYRSRHL